MSEIILSAEQARLVADAKGPVVVRTASGDVLGILEPVSAANQQDVAEMQARRSRPHQHYTIDQVLAKLGNNAN